MRKKRRTAHKPGELSFFVAFGNSLTHHISRLSQQLVPLSSLHLPLPKGSRMRVVLFHDASRPLGNLTLELGEQHRLEQGVGD